jgi:hypothetical protein
MVKSLTAFSQEVLKDLGDLCGVCTARDELTVARRVEEEGESFLTITLPQLNKAFLKALEVGRFDPSTAPSFKARGSLPVFLQGFLDQIFDRSTGCLRDITPPSEVVNCVRAIHQFTAMFAKIKMDCTPEREQAAFDAFVTCDAEVREFGDSLSQTELDRFVKAATAIFGDVFSRLDLAVYEGDIVPKHGPGSTAERLGNNSRYAQQEWTSRLESTFPFLENGLPNYRWWDVLDQVDFREPWDERPVRVVSVPKTLKTPRIIAIEPSCMQYMQQGLAEVIVGSIQDDKVLKALVGNLDQLPNRELARLGSRKRSVATLDLSEASDRVSARLVHEMLRNFPHAREAVFATRSQFADVPGHGVIPLAKFASMGSALCFPVEMMVFMTLTVMGVAESLRRPVTRGLLKELVGTLRVYGDDIIVPTPTTQAVIDHLESFGLLVNRGKSFSEGYFRESCGGDYYAGGLVTPIRVRSTLPSSRLHVSELISWVSLRNQLWEAGGGGAFLRSIDWIDGLVKPLLRAYPQVPPGSSILGRWSYQPQVDGFSSDTFVPLVRAECVESRLPLDQIEGHAALMKFFLKRGDLPVHQREHLERAGRAVSVRMKTRLVPVQQYGKGA